MSLKKKAENLNALLPVLGDMEAPSVFLGGDCTDNDWREEIKKDYVEKFVVLDPYDSKWDAKKNIYTELAGLVMADHVVFYKGGKGSENEKAFLKRLNLPYQDFEDLDELKQYLDSLDGTKKIQSLPEMMRRTAGLIIA